MGRPIIEVENLSKRYRLGTIGVTSLRETFNRWWDGVRKRSASAEAKDFWALQNISFAVQPGEVVGVIGRNGAGKSTLLKILSRITEPTAGRAVIRGRIASLLEVGTGFHPELTGRENIYLNGAILGMMRADIKKKLDEIVAFAEVDQFIDTPVKRYSSGMYVRLAFAVAAHLEPEVLIVDEVLAVGDSAFQKKCLGKMSDVAKHGRTVLFVSHNMTAVTSLCERVICLAGGRVVMEGPTARVTEQYLSAMVTHSATWQRPDGTPPQPDFCFMHARVTNSRGETCSIFDSDRSPTIEVDYVVKRALSDAIVTARLENSQGIPVFEVGDTDALGVTGRPREAGTYRGVFSVPAHFLSPGLYSITVGSGVLGRMAFEVIANVVAFEILPAKCVQSVEKRSPGITSPLFPWQTQRIA